MDLADDVRSPVGHAAVSMKGTNDRWVQIQLNTFTNWVNEQLLDTDTHVTNLIGDLCDGIKLCYLLEMIQGRKIGRIIKKPLNQHHCIENVNLAIRAMVSDNIKLVNIGSEDIVNGNPKLTMALIWHLILRYQIGKSKVPPKKLMLSWINAVIPDLNITNFSTDWNDGIALQALIDYCRPGTYPNWRQASRKDGFKNCKEAMELAKQYFGIPLVLSPENLSSPDLDELSGMTYLSYFMKVDSPGYKATLGWVRSQVPQQNVKNFQSSWNDGTTLTALVKKLGGDIPKVNSADPETIISAAMSAARGLGVEPVISAAEMADPEVDHLGVMAYAAWFQRVKNRKPEPHLMRAEKVVPVASQPPLTPAPAPEPRTPPEKMIEILWRRQDVYINKPVTFTLEGQDKHFDPQHVRVEVIGPQGTHADCKVNWSRMKGQGMFVPKEAGDHKVLVYYDGALVRGAPLTVEAKVDINSVKFTKPKVPSHAGMSTAITISAADVKRGAVVVNATSPSGKTHRMTVEEKNGVYTANFTPTEVGDWNISILYDGQHIQGSPFDVRVYDASRVRVLDLRGGAVGKMFAFTVKADGAGEGKLDVNIVHNGVTIPATIIPTNPAMQEYEVQFTPPGSGLYTIRVFFGGVEVPNSPFKLEIIDSSSVTATGRGLTNTAINTSAEFVINTGTTSKDGDLRVEITAPSGAKLANQVIDNNNGTYTVRYVVSEIGEYIIDVYFYGKPIKGSPFKVQAYDLSSIHISVPPVGIVDKLVEFHINAARAGSGNLEIMVNDGKIPCSVQNRGNRQFHASFMPRSAGVYYIQVKFHGQPLYNSPWRVDVKSAANMTVGGSGLQMVPINTHACFEVKTGGLDHGDVRINITSPSGRIVPSTIKNLGRGDYSVEYIPTEVGNHLVEVTYDGIQLPGSPFTSKAYDVNAVVIQPVTGGVVGGHVEFTVDVSMAGEGQLEIMVDGGTIPNHVSMLKKGVFKVDFVPREARPHKVDVRFNGLNAPGSPFMVPVMDTKRITAIGDGLRHTSVNKQAFFRVNTQAAGSADLSVKVTSPNGQLVPAQILQQPDGDYKVEYSSKYTGRHTVEILYNNQPIMGSPFYVEIYDPNKVVVTGSPEGTVGVPMSVQIITKDAGKASLALNIVSPSGRNVPYNITQNADGSGNVVEYVPTEPGPHQIYITYGDLDVAGTPITQNIIDTAANVSAFGQGLQTAEKGHQATFMIDTKGRRGNIEVHVKGTHTISQVQLDSVGNQFQASYVPMETGLFQVSILWNGQPIPGSPFHVNVTEPFDINSITPIGGWYAVLDAEGKMFLKSRVINTIDFDTSKATNCTLSATVESPNREVVPVTVEKSANGAQTTISFVPRTSGMYSIRIFCNDMLLPRCPITAVATDPIDHEKVVLTGVGLQEAVVNQQAEFIIDGTEAGPGEPNVKLSGVKKDIPVHLESIGPNMYKATYVPVIPGAYLLSITWNNRLVRGSPFKVNIKSGANASKVSVNTDGFRQSVFGKEIKAIIDTRRAGPGELTAHCMGPNKVAYCELLDHRDGTFTLNIKPQEPGKHILQVKYGGEHVPGSPFLLKVAGPPDASKVRVSGPGVESGILANFQSRFIVETRGAGAGQLTVRIRGPKGAFHVEMQRESQKDRTILCRYGPTEVGTYIIHVKWSGEHVPGSPFRIQIFDTMSELTEYLANNQNRTPRPYTDNDQWSENL